MEAPETSFSSYLDNRTPNLLKDVSKFEEYQKKTWADPDERHIAATKIYKVRQTGSLSEP